MERPVAGGWGISTVSYIHTSLLVLCLEQKKKTGWNLKGLRGCQNSEWGNWGSVLSQAPAQLSGAVEVRAETVYERLVR